MKPKYKSYILKKILPSFVLLIAVFISLIKINVINTKTLSPLGNTNENYEIVSEKFGKDFSNFIKDNSMLKIYCENNNDILVRFKDSNFTIKSSSSFINDFNKKIDKIINEVKSFKKI